MHVAQVPCDRARVEPFREARGPSQTGSPVQRPRPPRVRSFNRLCDQESARLRLSGANWRGFDEEIAEELRARAKDALLTMAIASEEQLGAQEPAEDLLTMDGMDRQLAFVLASRAVVTMEDLAEQSIDELLDIEGMTEERAGELIMTARAPWFAEESA